MIATIVSLLVAIALAVGAGPLCWYVLQWSALKVTWPPPDAAATTAGAGLGLLFLLWRKPNWFLHTAVHELCHFLVCLLVFVRPTGISITDGKGGAVEHVQTDPVRSTIISIAPYTLPLLLLPVLAIRHFVITSPDPWRHVMSGLCALLFVTHLQGLFHNVRINITGDQSDLVKVGRPLSAVLITLILMLVTAWTLRALWTGEPSGH
ncbi:MAG: hypothetical protein AAB263_20010 [Planctomycetota bacterium]